MTYDPDARRETPLAPKLRARIRRDGPITVQEYMRVCLQDPEHGYYRTRTAIGHGGDFITAPEISQIFGELIGLWCAVVWQQMGSPKHVNLIELGPGRGTMLRDALRAARVMPGFLSAAHIALIDSNASLMAEQKLALADWAASISWRSSLPALLAQDPDPGEVAPWRRPAIIIGNEYLDCLPQPQLVRIGDGWLSRHVGLDDADRLSFGVGHAATASRELNGRSIGGLDQLYPAAMAGDIVEPGHHAWIDEHLVPWPAVAALFIDYGHVTHEIGDTLQAVRQHRYEHPLTSPGEADLTQQVDFAAVSAQALARDTLRVDGPIPQAAFLGSLGIAERASRLMAANPAQAAAIETGVARLMAPTGMGTRFKVLGLRSATLPPLPGFPPMDRRR